MCGGTQMDFTMTNAGVCGVEKRDLFCSEEVAFFLGTRVKKGYDLFVRTRELIRKMKFNTGMRETVTF